MWDGSKAPPHKDEGAGATGDERSDTEQGTYTSLGRVSTAQTLRVMPRLTVPRLMRVEKKIRAPLTSLVPSVMRTWADGRTSRVVGSLQFGHYISAASTAWGCRLQSWPGGALKDGLDHLPLHSKLRAASQGVSTGLVQVASLPGYRLRPPLTGAKSTGHINCGPLFAGASGDDNGSTSKTTAWKIHRSLSGEHVVSLLRRPLPLTAQSEPSVRLLLSEIARGCGGGTGEGSGPLALVWAGRVESLWASPDARRAEGRDPGKT